MTYYLHQLLAFLLALGLLVTVHELGHYLVARWCGVQVLRFSVGFGRTLWQRTAADGTVWAIGAIPLGGYVKMLGEEEGDDIPVAQQKLAFNRQVVWKRSAIVAAGPLANFLLAFLLYCAVFFVGSEELLPVLGTPQPGSVAAQAGLSHGQKVLSVDGEPVATWQDFRWLLLKKAGDSESVQLEVINEKDEISQHLLFLTTIVESGWEGEALDRLGLTIYRPFLPPVIGKVLPDGVADRVGLQQGDEFVEIDGKEVDSWIQVVQAIRGAADRSMELVVLRRGEFREFRVTPEAVEDRIGRIGKIGIAAPQPSEELNIRANVRYDLFSSVIKAARETGDKTWF
ncbi:MAG: metalloprotease RseP, partial [Pseudomonadota bacterium]